MTIKSNNFNNLSNANYAVGNEIIYPTEVLKPNFCDYILHAYILLWSDISIIGQNNATQVAFEDCAPFNKSITKIDGTAIDDAEDLDLVMPMYNLLKCRWNYFNTAGSWGFHSKGEPTNLNNDIAILIFFNLLCIKVSY